MSDGLKNLRRAAVGLEARGSKGVRPPRDRRPADDTSSHHHTTILSRHQILTQAAGVQQTFLAAALSAGRNKKQPLCKKEAPGYGNAGGREGGHAPLLRSSQTRLSIQTASVLYERCRHLILRRHGTTIQQSYATIPDGKGHQARPGQKAEGRNRRRWNCTRARAACAMPAPPAPLMSSHSRPFAQSSPTTAVGSTRFVPPLYLPTYLGPRLLNHPTQN